MNESLLPARYAKALYRFASEKNLAKNVYDAMLNIAKVFDSERGHDFMQSISNPFIDSEAKRLLIKAAAGDMTAPTWNVVNDFISLLLQNNRIGELRGIVLAYDSLYRRENNIARVHVTWASQPMPASEEQLKGMIQQRLGTGSMEYSSHVDPSLIGGFKISIDNEQLDASVENELRQLRQQILRK